MECQFSSLTKAVYSGLLCVGIVATAGCSSDVNISGNTASGAATTITEVENEITVTELKAGLKKAKFLLTGNPFLTQSENQIASLEDYSAALDGFIGSQAAAVAIQNFYMRLFGLPTSDLAVPKSGAGATLQNLYDRFEPAALPAYLYLNQKNYKEFVTADYCVGRAEDGFPQRVCRNAGVVSATNSNRWEEDLPQELRAGFITTQAFLDSSAGALNFRRAKRVQEYTMCVKLPLGVETSAWNEPGYAAVYPDPNLNLHPFYWTSRQVPGAMDCTSCHGSSPSLNSWRVLFTGFDADGSARMGQTVVVNGQNQTLQALTVNNVESGLILNAAGYAVFADYGLLGPTQGSSDPNTATPFEPNIAKVMGQTLTNFSRGNPQRTYPRIADMTQAIVDHPAFSECMATQYFHLAMKGEPQPIEYKPPTYLMTELVNVFQNSGYNAQALLKAIFLSGAYLNQ